MADEPNNPPASPPVPDIMAFIPEPLRRATPAESVQALAKSYGELRTKLSAGSPPAPPAPQPQPLPDNELGGFVVQMVGGEESYAQLAQQVATGGQLPADKIKGADDVWARMTSEQKAKALLMGSWGAAQAKLAQFEAKANEVTGGKWKDIFEQSKGTMTEQEARELGKRMTDPNNAASVVAELIGRQYLTSGDKSAADKAPNVPVMDQAQYRAGAAVAGFTVDEMRKFKLEAKRQGRNYAQDPTFLARLALTDESVKNNPAVIV